MCAIDVEPLSHHFTWIPLCITKLTFLLIEHAIECRSVDTLESIVICFNIIFIRNYFERKNSVAFFSRGMKSKSFSIFWRNSEWHEKPLHCHHAKSRCVHSKFVRWCVHFTCSSDNQVSKLVNYKEPYNNDESSICRRRRFLTTEKQHNVESWMPHN